MKMFRLRSTRVPSPYRDRVGFLDHWFVVMMINDYKFYQPKKFLFGEPYMMQYYGNWPADSPSNKKWFEDIDNLYACLHINPDHWVALDINFPKKKIYVYDSIPSCKQDKEIMAACEPFRKMIPAMLNVFVPQHLRKQSLAQFQVQRVNNAKNNIPIAHAGDCGVYALKYIECLALGWKFDGLNNDNIQAIREKLAAEIYDEIPGEKSVRMSNPLPRRAEIEIPHLQDTSEMAYTLRNINKALKQLTENPHPNFSAGPVDDDPFHWEAVIIGPSDTPYEGGVFKLSIHFPPQYPIINPPKVCFKTKMYHPNIRDTGGIGLGMLTAAKWSPGSNIIEVFHRLVQMLIKPELGEENNFDPEIANLYLSDKASYDSKAREMTILNAGGSDCT